MSKYAVRRTYGKFGKDYLHAWCKDWGSACMGSVKKAMIFDTLEQADAAAKRAQVECKGFGGAPAIGFTFSAVAI